ncbi:MOSC domain-containing protein [Paenibacillus sp. J5C_2022]|uniref:MOSC domain-containing protein n=1 Tax=Paenibacillus sp. J5C2022 TaxID=2977129 RepID=UPI0021CF8B76|nr:MOSC N-terminal beta barrel domain-containing protein [Paenibacillus sp. J5C2022]MCU6713103.1 MOSC domain-containing protein [Paenibacillus sp. J5C2022]
MKPIGRIAEVWRYPVKSFAGESLTSCQVESYGLYGDRFYTFSDESKQGWNSFVTARDIPQMLTYEARLLEDELIVRSPEGATFSWGDKLLEEMARHARRPITMRERRAPHPEYPELMSVDEGSILILLAPMLDKLEQAWGKKLDSRRFRANLIIETEDLAATDEAWIGRSLRMGNAVVKVDSRCDRCSIVTMDPDTTERDASLLKQINEGLDLCFGVYASVKETGIITVGDSVYEV